MVDARLIYDAKAVVGESIVWDERENCLFWVDIIRGTIHRLDPATGDHHYWKGPGLVTSIGLRKNGGAVVGLAKTVAMWDFGEEFAPLADIEPDLPENRLNEGVVGPDGAFWVGTMQNNINRDGSPREMSAKTGALYRVSADGAVRQISERCFGITNTLVWTRDRRLITADTMANSLYSFGIHPQSSQLEDRRVIQSGFDRGLPDGSCPDADGYFWNCRVAGGACVARFAPDGRLDRIVDLPCSWPTSCVFGGPDLSTLYITSARFTMSDKHLAENPNEGGIFAVDPGARGVPGNRFGS